MGAVTTVASPRVVVLTAATVVWGSTFVVTKDSLLGMTAPAFLTWRFGLAAVVLLLAGARRVRRLSTAELGHGVLLGTFLGAGFLLQTAGLTEVPAAVSGFLTGTMVVLTPLVAAAVFRERVGGTGWAAVAGATCGITLLSLRGWSFGTGTVLTLAGAAGFAFHISGLSRWATPTNAYGLTAVSVTVAAALSTAASLISGGLVAPPTWSAWAAVTYLALAATCAGFAAQAWAQSGLTATQAAVIMTLEPVFAAVLAIAIRGETLTSAAALGGLIIVASMFIAEFGPRECCDAMAPRVECC